MKTAFKIKQEDAVESDGGEVLIEMGRYGFSILWFNKDPLTIEGVATYNFPADITTDLLLENVQSILNENKFGNGTRVYIFYNFEESILIPFEFYKADKAAHQLNLVYGPAPDSLVAQEVLRLDTGNGKQEEVYNVYLVPAGISEAFGKITSLTPKHSTSVQVNLPRTNVLQCTIFHNAIKVFLYGNDKLLIVQQFRYKTPADVVYHLLNTCDKYDVSPAEVNLVLNGMVDSESNLYQEIYKYFLNVHFNTVPDDIFLSAGIKEHPLHYVSHLTELARCV